MFSRFSKSIWFFPVILLIPVLVFTSLKISGSSVGYIHEILYGNTKDPNLIANEPEGIRSDEWLVNTQQTVLQSKDNFPEFNKNIGNGEDMSTFDVPYKNWSAVFKPHNLIFFVLPLQNAFAFKWWIMGYLLIVSCYLFILTLMPDRKLLAIFLSLAFFFSAFVQWWYAYGTLGSLYYSLFIAVVFINLLKQKELYKKILLGVLLSYLLVCFALVLYPPFQIACGLTLGFFLVGYVIQNYSELKKKDFKKSVLITIGSLFICLCIVGLFIETRSSAIKSTENTSYPGNRSIKSGGIYPYHFMSSQLGYQFISNIRTSKYLIDGKNVSNQSEDSNFLLLIPFLFIPSIYLIYREKKDKRKLDWSLIFLDIIFIIFLLELFIGAFTPLSSLFLLNKAGPDRILIGVGLLNLMFIVLFIKNLIKKKQIFSNKFIYIYTFLVLIVELVVNFHAYLYFYGFIRLRETIIFAIPIPLVIYLLLRKKYLAAVIIYTLFSVFISFRVNPLYRGLDILTKNPIDIAIQNTGVGSNKRWATYGGYLENIALVNGKPSVSGVYNYPQFSMWNTIPGAKKFDYNRYAHVGFVVVGNTSQPTTLDLLEKDSFVIETNSCSNYLKKLNVGFLVTPVVIKNNCTILDKTLSFPLTTVYIYSIKN